MKFKEQKEIDDIFDRLKSDYFRIEMKRVNYLVDLDYMLKSDYFRIEMRIARRKAL